MRRLSLWGAALFAALSVPWLAWADRVGEAGAGHGQMWNHGWGGMIFGPLMMLVFIALIVGIVVLVVRWLGGGPAQGAKPKAALDILEERFARGEIDKDELEDRRRALQG